MLETQSTRRLQWLLWILLLWVVAIFGRLIYLQIFQHEELKRLAEHQQQKTVEIQADRGAIFDRTGQPLARSVLVDSVVVNPKRIPDLGVAADLLSRVLDLDRKQLRDRLQTAADHKSGFLWVKRKISTDESVRLRSMGLDWVEFRQEIKRYYPRNSLASHVIGSTGFVGDAERGNAGIELTFDRDLSGKPGKAQVFNDVKQNPYDTVVVEKPEPGADLTLTIDPNLQYISERELDKAIASSGAISGSIVVLNPQNGDVLAMANYPRYDPNRAPSAKEPPHARSNLAISTPFEPGSVFKVITVSAALETTSLTPDSLIDCGNGFIRLPGRTVRDDHKYSILSMADVLAKSSNVGAIRVGMRVGENRLYDYVRKFGFGKKSGIELPGESAGILRQVKDWTPGSIGSVAMGHEVGTTSIQLALAGAMVANGGLQIKPRLVMARQRPGGALENIPVEPAQRVLKAETAIEMRKMMEGVVLRGTGKGHATIKGYTSGGKTGSAQIWDPKTRSYTHQYNASFLGFAPVANPQIVVAVTLNRTTRGTAGYGGPAAAPVFREVATHGLRMLDVPKDLPDKEPEVSASAVSSGDDLERVVSSVTPPLVREAVLASAGAGPSDQRRFFGPSLEGSEEAGTAVPNFEGMTLRAVLEAAASQGLTVRASGSGLARSQDPLPGTRMSEPRSIRVQFGR